MPRQSQNPFKNPQSYPVLISNPDVAIPTTYYNTVLLNFDDVVRPRVNPLGPDPVGVDCAAAVKAKLQAVLEIYQNQIAAANAAREAAIKNAIIDFLMSLLGLDLIVAFNEIIKELWQDTNYESFVAMGAIPPTGPINPYNNRYNHFQPGPLRWPNGVMVDGQWIPGPGGPPRPGRPGWVPPEPKPTPPAPPKPPVMDRKIVEMGRTNPLAWKQWIEDNWRKIFGKIPIKSLSALFTKLLTRLGILGLVNLAAQVSALLYLLAAQDAIFEKELRLAEEKMKAAEEWSKKALACCSRAKACGKSGEGCHKDGVMSEPQDGCDTTT